MTIHIISTIIDIIAFCFYVNIDFLKVINKIGVMCSIIIFVCLQLIFLFHISVIIKISMERSLSKGYYIKHNDIERDSSLVIFLSYNRFRKLACINPKQYTNEVLHIKYHNKERNNTYYIFFRWTCEYIIYWLSVLFGYIRKKRRENLAGKNYDCACMSSFIDCMHDDISANKKKYDEIIRKAIKTNQSLINKYNIEEIE